MVFFFAVNPLNFESTVNIRKRIFVTIFGTDTPAGKAFDVALLYLIIISVLVVVLESVHSIRDTHPLK